MAKILFLGDIVGRPGREGLVHGLKKLQEQQAIDWVIANGENAAAGAGLTAAIAQELESAGVQAITLGDHCWDQRGFPEEIGGLERVCRPANLPKVCPGRDHLTWEDGDRKYAVFTVLGQQFMKIFGDGFFRVAGEKCKELRRQGYHIIVEHHAETTSEKIAMGWYLDGLASLVVGTHTHVLTADNRVLPRGTGYITDLGMCGPHDGVLGREIEPVVARFLDGMPRKFPVASANVRLCGVLAEIDDKTGICRSIERVDLPVGNFGDDGKLSETEEE